MEENSTDFWADDVMQYSTKYRKSLLPLWIKVFAWIFLIISAFVPVILVLGLMGYNAQSALYGLETDKPFSVIGIIVAMIFSVKGITAFGLLNEKDWAIKLGVVDAVLGIIICISVMVYPIINSATEFILRLELVVLIPYLLKLLKIKMKWEGFAEE